VTGQYDCGGEGADPQGVHPFSCPPLQTAPDATGTDVSLPDVPCPHVPDGGCCEGSRLWWCEEGTEQSFDCATLAADPVFASYLYCGANPASGHADCLKKGDPSPPECTFGAEPAAEIAEVGGETFDVEMPEPGPEPVDLAGAEEQSAAEAAPDLWSKDHGQFIVEGAEAQVEPGRGGGGCGCSFAAPGPGSGGMTVCLALLAALVVARRVARRGPRLEQGE
jgi:hypothetical protein